MKVISMGLYKYLQKLWNEGKFDLKTKMIEWRKESSVVRTDFPTRLDRAHALGYKAKKGIFVARARIDRGGRKRPKIRKGRRTKARVYRQDLNMNYRWIAEQRASQKFPNCEVLNSYFVGKDGNNYFYEIIMVDRAHPEIMADKQLSWIAGGQRGRAERGLTSAAKKSRGLRWKGKGAEKMRPSASAHENRNK